MHIYSFVDLKHLATKDWAGKMENYGIRLRYTVPGVGETEKGVYQRPKRRGQLVMATVAR